MPRNGEFVTQWKFPRNSIFLAHIRGRAACAPHSSPAVAACQVDYHRGVQVDTSGWSGDGEFTKRLIDALGAVGCVSLVKVEDAPASREDSGFSFISNEVFVLFGTAPVRAGRGWRGAMARLASRGAPSITLEQLEASLAAMPGVGAADYSDEGMLQYLRTERIVPPYQTRGYKLIELVRLYRAGTTPRREP